MPLLASPQVAQDYWRCLRPDGAAAASAATAVASAVVGTATSSTATATAVGAAAAARAQEAVTAAAAVYESVTLAAALLIASELLLLLGVVCAARMIGLRNVARNLMLAANASTALLGFAVRGASARGAVLARPRLATRGA